jgi:hypothetical protein
MALTDQQIRDAGILYLSPQKYLLNPFKLPEEEQEGEGGGGGGGGTTPSFSKTFSGGINTLPQSQLMGGFEEALAARQKRLTSPDPFAQKAYDLGFPKQRSVDQMIRDATAFNMAQLGPDFSQIGITSNMTGPEIRQAMAEYAADETSIGNYPVEDPRDVRFQFGIPTLGRILSAALPSSYYDKMTVPEQIYTQTKMGYTGPTVFGENTTGGNKDIFGRNVVSGFGNYVEKQKKDIAKLDEYFGSELFDERYGEDTVLEFDETIGQFVFKGPGAEAATRRNRLNLLRYNYDKQGLKEFEDIKDQTGFTDIMEAENRGTTDYGITAGVPDKDYSAVDNLDRAIEKARERSDRQDEGKGPGGSTFDYSDPYEPGGGEKDGGFIDGTNRRKLNVGGLAGMLGY